MPCTKCTTFHHTCTHIQTFITHDPPCSGLSICPLSTSSLYIVNGLCPWCTGEREIPHGNLPVLDEELREERRTMYEAVVREQMMVCEARVREPEKVRLG
jgi:hypothetical protein